MDDSSSAGDPWSNQSNWPIGLIVLIIAIVFLILAVIFYRLSITCSYFFHCDVTNLATESGFMEFPMNRDQAMSSMNVEIYKQSTKTPFIDLESQKSNNQTSSMLGINNQSATAVISVSVGDRPFAKISHNRLKSYCGVHGYDLFYYTENLDDDYKPFWQKVVAMQKVLAMKNSNGTNKYDMTFWIDDDIYITNMGYRIEDFLILSDHKDIVMSRDIIDDYNIHINTGTYIIRNTEIGRRFIDETLEGYYWYKGWYQSNRFHEQTIMTYLYFRNYHQYTAVLPHGIMQSFYRGNHWKYEDFALHLAGETTRTRTEIMSAMDQCSATTGEPWYQHVVTTEEWRYMLGSIQEIPTYARSKHSDVIFYDSNILNG